MVLENECCRILARLAGIRTYRLGNGDVNFWLVRTGYTPPDDDESDHLAMKPLNEGIRFKNCYEQPNVLFDES